MKGGMTTSLGIDIVASEVNAVLLRKGRAGFRVLGAARASLPPGTIEGGRIIDSAVLLKALRSVRECRRRQNHTELSLPPEAVMTRVVPLEEEDPQDIARFVQDEIAQYAAFSGKKMVTDFRVVAAARKHAPGKVMVAAVDDCAAEALAHACRSAGVGPDGIEPATLASLRVFQASKGRERLGSTVLLAILHGGIVTLMVLQKETLDFMRTQNLGSGDRDPAIRYGRVADEVNAVLQFYRVQARAINGVVLIDDESDLPDVEVQDAFRRNVAVETVDIWTRGNVSDFVSIETGLEGKGSIAAVGLAMGAIMDRSETARLNLVPHEANRARVLQRNLVLAAISGAALVLFLILITGALRWQAGRLRHDVDTVNETQRDGGSLPAAVEERGAIADQIAVASAELECLARTAELHVNVDWLRLLEEIRKAVPAHVRLTRLRMDGAPVLSLEGVAESDEAIGTLVSMLSRSGLIAQVELLEAGSYDGGQGTMRCAIECTLAPEERR